MFAPRARGRLAAALLPTALVAAVAAPSAVQAAPTITTLDGPSADVRVAGGIDVAADGTGALAYIKADGGADHVFVSRLSAGTWSAPQRVDVAPALAARDAKVAVYPGGGVVVTWLHGAGDGHLRSAISTATGQPFVLADIVDLAVVKAYDLDVADDGTGYVSFTEGFNVRAARLSGGTWTLIGGPANDAAGILDRTLGEQAADPGGQNESDIAAYPGGAVMVWSETDGVGPRDIIARRLTGTSAGAAQELSVDTLDGKPRGDLTDMPDVATAPDGTAWAAFRHGQLHGMTDRARVVVRRIAPDGTLGDPQIVDGSPATPTEGAEFPAIDLSPGGAHGLLSTPRQLTFHTFGSRLTGGTWAPGTQVSAGTPTAGPPGATAVGDTGFGVIAYRRVEGAEESVEAVSGTGVLAQPSERLSIDGAGEIAFNDTETVTAAADATGTSHVLFAQGAAASRRIVVATVPAPAAPAAPPAGTPGTPASPSTTPPTGTTPARRAFARRVLVTLPSTVRRRDGRLRITIRNREPFAVRATVRVRTRRVKGRPARTLLTTTATIGAGATRTLRPRIRTRAARAALRPGAKVTLRATLRAPQGRARIVGRTARVG